MLQNIRKHIQGWFAGIIIVLVAMSFIFFGIESYLQAENPKRATVAVVDGEKITLQQLQERYHRLLDQVPNANSLDENTRQAIRQRALTQLINEQALLQIANEMGLELSVVELEAAITNMPAFQVNGRFSYPLLQQVLMANHLTLQQFEKQIHQMLLLNQLRQAIQQGAFTLPSELEQNYALLEQQRDLGYFEISAQKMAADFHPTDAQIHNYYEKHQAEFMSPEQVSIQYVILSPGQLLKQVKLSQAEINEYYQQHRDNFSSKKTFTKLLPELTKRLKREKTEQLLAEKSEELANLSFTNPDSLEPIAKALNLTIQQSPLFSQQGMSTGVLHDPKVIMLAFSEEVLSEGNNSTPIELSDGSLLVLRVKEHKPPVPQALTRVHAMIVDHLAQKQVEKKAHQLAEQIANDLNSGMATSTLAKKYNLVWVERLAVKATNSELATSLVQAAFRTPVNAEGSKAVVVKLLQGNYAVLKVLAHHWGPALPLTVDQEKRWLTQMTASQAQLEYQLYEQGIVRQSKIRLKGVSFPQE